MRREGDTTPYLIDEPLPGFGVPRIPTHGLESCVGQWCAIHNPSPHHMVSWDLYWRTQKGVFERICVHGVGHPDPDDVAYQIRKHRQAIGRFDPEVADRLTIHTCCKYFCCSEKKGES